MISKILFAIVLTVFFLLALALVIANFILRWLGKPPHGEDND
jgi:small neutral amino acid transporter SnatA (MarC family)